MPRPLRIGLTVTIVHLLLTLGTGWIALLLRAEELTTGGGAPTLLTRLMMLLMKAFSFPLGALMPHLAEPATAEALVWLVLPLNSLLWGIAAALIARAWFKRVPPP